MPHGSVIRLWLAVDDLVVGNPTDLSEGLRQINFAGVLARGAYDAFVQGSVRRAMPAGLETFAVEYVPDALAAAAADLHWTFADLLILCARLDAAIQAGRLATLGIDQVL